MSKYQNEIITALKNGARLQSTEGSNYRAWLIFSDGTTKRVRRDSAEKVCMDYSHKLIFGEWGGIRYRN
jgi:hypothetical protein